MTGRQSARFLAKGSYQLCARPEVSTRREARDKEKSSLPEGQKEMDCEKCLLGMAPDQVPLTDYAEGVLSFNFVCAC